MNSDCWLVRMEFSLVSEVINRVVHAGMHISLVNHAEDPDEMPSYNVLIIMGQRTCNRPSEEVGRAT